MHDVSSPFMRYTNNKTIQKFLLMTLKLKIFIHLKILYFLIKTRVLKVVLVVYGEKNGLANVLTKCRVEFR